MFFKSGAGASPAPVFPPGRLPPRGLAPESVLSRYLPSRHGAGRRMKSRPPVTDWATDFDHLDPRWIENPYPIWDELRARCPIAHTDRFMGVYLPTRYEDVRAIAKDTERFSSHRVVVLENMPPRGGAAPITT